MFRWPLLYRSHRCNWNGVKWSKPEPRRMIGVGIMNRGERYMAMIQSRQCPECGVAQIREIPIEES
jgi:hypothetical protein